MNAGLELVAGYSGISAVTAQKDLKSPFLPPLHVSNTLTQLFVFVASEVDT